MYVQEEPDEPGTDNTRPIQAAFTGGRTCVISNPKLQRTYRAAILATNPTTVYTITATTLAVRRVARQRMEALPWPLELL
jgi:hypothetical protein